MKVVDIVVKPLRYYRKTCYDYMLAKKRELFL